MGAEKVGSVGAVFVTVGRTVIVGKVFVGNGSEIVHVHHGTDELDDEGLVDLDDQVINVSVIIVGV